MNIQIIETREVGNDDYEDEASSNTLENLCLDLGEATDPLLRRTWGPTSSTSPSWWFSARPRSHHNPRHKSCRCRCPRRPPGSRWRTGWGSTTASPRG